MTGEVAGMVPVIARAVLTDVAEPADSELAEVHRHVYGELRAAGHPQEVALVAVAKLTYALRRFGRDAETLRSSATDLIEARKAVHDLLNTERKSNGDG